MGLPLTQPGTLDWLGCLFLNQISMEPAMTATKKTAEKFPCHHCRTPLIRRQLILSPSGRLWCKPCSSRWQPVSTNSTGSEYRKAKPKKIKVTTGCCVVCDRRFLLKDLIKCPDTFQTYCEDHNPRRRIKKAEKSSTFGWYVLSVEPGSEGKVKKNLLRKLRIHNATSLVKRIIIARQFEDRIVPKKGEIVAEGSGHIDKRNATNEAKVRCQQICLKSGAEHRYYALPDKADEKGKESNTWGWRVVTVPADKEMRTIGVKKYPGYLICQLDFTPEFDRILKKVPQQWGLLLKPVHVGHLIQVTESVRYGGWMWKVRQPGDRTIVAKGGPKQTREEARTAAEDAKAKIEEFKPVPLDSEEAARELLSQQIFNDLNKNPQERDKAIINYRVGSTVEITEGAFRGVTTKVEKIDRTDKVHVKVWVNVPVCGHPVPAVIEYWQCRTIAY